MPPPAVLDRARQTLAAAPGTWLYARVDGCESEGGFRLMELEMLEPWLFFDQDPKAPGRFAAALAEALSLPRRFLPLADTQEGSHAQP